MAALYGLGSLFKGVVEGYKDVSGIIRDQQANEWFGIYQKAWKEDREAEKKRRAEADAVKTTPIPEKAADAPTTPAAPTPALTPPQPTATPVGLPRAPAFGTMLPGGRAPGGSKTPPPAPIDLTTPTFAPIAAPAAAPAAATPKPFEPDAASDASAGVPAPYQPPPVVRINPDGTSITPVAPPAPSALGIQVRNAPTTSGWGTAEAIGRGAAGIPAQLYDYIRRGLATPTPIQPPRALNPSAPAYVAPTVQTDAFGRPIADPNTATPRGILY